VRGQHAAPDSRRTRAVSTQAMQQSKFGYWLGYAIWLEHPGAALGLGRFFASPWPLPWWAPGGLGGGGKQLLRSWGLGGAGCRAPPHFQLPTTPALLWPMACPPPSAVDGPPLMPLDWLSHWLGTGHRPAPGPWPNNLAASRADPQPTAHSVPHPACLCWLLEQG
jgi:hypothetical protein